MPFKFRLQTVLDLARRIKDQRAQALAEAQEVHRAELARLEALVSEQEQRRAELKLAQEAGAIDLQTIQWALAYLVSLQGQEAGQREVARQAEARVEAARAQLLETAQEVQVLEKLEAKARKDYQIKLDKAEAALIDELSTIRFSRAEPST